MRLTNPRQAIHDAFAIHLGGPSDNLGGGGGKFNSTKWLEKAGVAGLVIRAVMNQTAHLRSAAIFLNAPENTISGTDIIILKASVWSAFIQKHEVSPQDQGILIGFIDRIFMGYRSRIRNHVSQQNTLGGMFGNYTKEAANRLTDLSNKMLDVLHTYDDRSQAPVWAVIDAEREALDAERDQESQKRQHIAYAMDCGVSWTQAKRQADEAEDAQPNSEAA
jgi:hypothetical protein